MSVYTPITYDRMFWGIPKAWVNFDGNGTIKKSYNISSVIKSSTGIFTIYFVEKLEDSNYAINITLGSSTDLICGMVAYSQVDSFTINTRGNAIAVSGIVTNKLTDPVSVYCVIF